MKDWKAGRIGVVSTPVVDNNSTKEQRSFLERKRLGDGFRYSVSCTCFGLRALVYSFKHEALWLVAGG